MKHWTYSVCETDEQLAMLLGHEISHMIHQHTEDSTYLKAALLGAQLMLLSVLDFTGLVSMLAVLGIQPLLTYSVELPFSREHEFEADATGLRIAARAGYNPRDAAKFFERLSKFSEVLEGGSSKRSWSSTHPTTEDRIAQLKELEADAMKLYKPRVEKVPLGLGDGLKMFVLGSVATLLATAAGFELFK
eukprot:TRINITY_DN39563_c0_g1_i2.p1 TRINITY_DN39563_c0_g1~~TRINITY_DN39563_c0_g1_i2.p1  ORF type:complete len:190 (-),score=47.19 TRINITY_DN39563_c0_g1_i2:104-673(-)